MKKILLSLVAVFAALSLSAKEEVTSATVIEFSGAWNWQLIKAYSTGDLITDETAKTVDDSQLVYTDMSAYDYLVIDYAESTTEVKVGIQFNTNGVLGQWGAEFYEGSTSISKSPKGAIAGIKLDPDHKNTVNCIYVQNTNNAGSLTINSIYFATEAEYQAALDAGTIKYEEGKAITMDGGNILDTEFDGFSMDAKVEFVYQVTGDAAKYNNWGAGAISSLDSSVKVLDCPVKGEGENKVTCYLSQLVEAMSIPTDWTDVDAYGLFWNMWGFDGCTCTITSATIYEQVGTTSEKYVAKGLVSKTAAPLYVIGNVNGGGWTTEKACAELAYDSANKVYTGEITVDDGWDGAGWFAIGGVLSETAEDWTTFNAERYAISADWGTLNEKGTISKGVDASFKLPVGTYTVTVDLEAMTILITESATAISPVKTATTAKSGKFFENGKVVIYKNGQKYNVAGQLVK